MKTISVKQASEKWRLSERTIRKYCLEGRIPGAYRSGNKWNLPKDAVILNANQSRPQNLLQILREEKASNRKGGIYHKIQVEMTCNSSRMEGCRLSTEQTRFIYETNTLSSDGGVLNVDDIIETVNHFRCIDLVIDKAGCALSEAFIKKLHDLLKSGTSDSRKSWFSVGGYKKIANEVGGLETAAPKEVEASMRQLLAEYSAIRNKTLKDLIDFHVRFETIHPFQDGNGRIGRLILLKECLKYDIVPLLVDDSNKALYYRGLNEWKHEQGCLMETCLCAQDQFRKWLDYFRIPYRD